MKHVVFLGWEERRRMGSHSVTKDNSFRRELHRKAVDIISVSVDWMEKTESRWWQPLVLGTWKRPCSEFCPVWVETCCLLYAPEYHGRNTSTSHNSIWRFHIQTSRHPSSSFPKPMILLQFTLAKCPPFAWGYKIVLPWQWKQWGNGLAYASSSFYTVPYFCCCPYSGRLYLGSHFVAHSNNFFEPLSCLKIVLESQ